jgi:NhaA family Na+:H+ antiporter
MHPQEIIGVAALGGIGFTVSLFITDLAFDTDGLIGQAKVGILTASAAAALIGTALLLRVPTGPRHAPPEANLDREDRASP